MNPSRTHRFYTVLVAACLVMSLACDADALDGGQCSASAIRNLRQDGVPVYSYTVLNKHPHDPAAFTQGLLYDSGRFIEGTGLWGRSEVRHVDIASGEVTHSISMDDEYFGEGITLWKGDIVQLTWKARKGFVYDSETLVEKSTWSYANAEGWGLTHDGTSLIMSDGSSALYFLNPVTFARERVVTVTLNGVALSRLNELEYIDGEVWANVWFSNNIYRIDPSSGDVLSVVNLSGILTAEDRNGARVDVLNGIAHDPDTNRIWVTGKLWPMLYEIQVDDPDLDTPTKPDPSASPSPSPHGVSATASTSRSYVNKWMLALVHMLVVIFLALC